MNRKSDYKNIDRWRETARKQKKKYYGRTTDSENKGQRWTTKEIEIVLAHEITDTEISKKINRSVQAIQIARCRYAKK